MSTVIVAEFNGLLKTEDRKIIREMLMKELEEGLVVKDDTYSLSVINTVGGVGIEFNKED